MLKNFVFEHNMGTLGDKIMPKLCSKYACENCDYFTDKKSSFENHLKSNKHKMVTNGLQMGYKIMPIMPNICSCGKQYLHRQGLWRHKKNCMQTKQNNNNEIITKDQITPELVVKVVEQNYELIHMINKLYDNNTNNNITNINNNSNNNSNNKNFNLNFFLNETCKDAMNISEFVSSIKVSIDDLENTGRQGYIQGISNIIINNLNKLEQHLRPLHCSDYKREIMYIKDNNEWLKETENKPILTKAIKTIANENIKQINKWRDNYPDCTDSDSMKNDLYLKIVSNSMNGLTKEESDKNINKIITNVAKKVVIEK